VEDDDNLVAQSQRGKKLQRSQESQQNLQTAVQRNLLWGGALGWKRDEEMAFAVPTKSYAWQPEGRYSSRNKSTSADSLLLSTSKLVTTLLLTVQMEGRTSCPEPCWTMRSLQRGNKNPTESSGKPSCEVVLPILPQQLGGPFEKQEIGTVPLVSTMLGASRRGPVALQA